MHRGERMIQKEKKENKRKVWLSWIVWIVVILILSRSLSGEQKVAVTVEADGLSFQTESGYTSELKWDDISTIELREGFAYGTLAEGTDNSKEKSGIWYNETFGEYELIANAKVANCIVCFTESGRVMVFNYESEESTRSLLTAIQEKIAQNEY